MQLVNFHSGIFGVVVSATEHKKLRVAFLSFQLLLLLLFLKNFKLSLSPLSTILIYETLLWQNYQQLIFKSTI